MLKLKYMIFTVTHEVDPSYTVHLFYIVSKKFYTYGPKSYPYHI